MVGVAGAACACDIPLFANRKPATNAITRKVATNKRAGWRIHVFIAFILLFKRTVVRDIQQKWAPDGKGTPDTWRYAIIHIKWLRMASLLIAKMVVFSP